MKVIMLVDAKYPGIKLKKDKTETVEEKFGQWLIEVGKATAAPVIKRNQAKESQ